MTAKVHDTLGHACTSSRLYLVTLDSEQSSWHRSSVTSSGWLVFCLFCADMKFGGGGPCMTGKCVGKYMRFLCNVYC